jgi:hypothetical protein
MEARLLVPLAVVSMPEFLNLAVAQTPIITWVAVLVAQQAVLQAALAQPTLTFAIIHIRPALVVVAAVVALRLAVLVAQAATTVVVAVVAEPGALQALLAAQAPMAS